MPTGYKVVRKYNGQFLSAVPHATIVNYFFDKWVKPSPSGYEVLFVFANREKARAFRRERGDEADFAIHKCEYREYVKPKVGTSTTDAWLERMVWPKGTVFASEVKILKPAPKLRKVFKVVRRNRTSAVRGMDRGGVIYPIKGWAKPLDGQKPFLFVFDTKENARAAIRSYGWSERVIFEARGKNVTKEREGMSASGRLFKQNEDWPKGTLFADEVMLVKKA